MGWQNARLETNFHEYPHLHCYRILNWITSLQFRILLLHLCMAISSTSDFNSTFGYAIECLLIKVLAGHWRIILFLPHSLYPQNYLYRLPSHNTHTRTHDTYAEEELDNERRLHCTELQKHVCLARCTHIGTNELVLHVLWIMGFKLEIWPEFGLTRTRLCILMCYTRRSFAIMLKNSPLHMCSNWTYVWPPSPL